MSNKSNNNIVVRIVFTIALALGFAPFASATGEPSTGIATVDAVIVTMVGAVAAITTMYGLGAAIRGGSVVWNKVVKFFSKSL